MATLKDLLLSETKRPLVVEDSVRVINEEVESKGGLSGMVIKTAFKVVKAVKTGIIKESVEALLDDFVARLEPHYENYQAGLQNQAGPAGIEKYVTANAPVLADALLGITDARAKKSTNRALKGAYEKLRPEGKRQVEAAMPRIGRMLAKHGA